ncbi:diaminopropionate ammonia-lyase [Candidatus Palauibacter sp.]|uniref:diaminopropionate ammonia-lyase n=1 Tax=Candidatus Palauibacter sp. TaxID=3101350 RepID=UPI003CC5BA84
MSQLRLSLRSPLLPRRATEGTLDPATAAAARDVIRGWAGYEATPLVTLPGLAALLGVEAVWVKDESSRFGLGSFKSLGGAFAVLRALQDEIERRSGARPTGAELRAGHPLAAEITVTTASAGNHGRSVAWGSAELGCRCVVFLPDDAIPARARAIESHGAEVVRVPGAYDGAVAHTDRAAARNGWIVVSDTAYEGYEETPRRVMAGYTLLAAEMLEALASAGSAPLTHLFVQAGVGGLATGVCGHFAQRCGEGRPRFVAVEPWRADCFGRSLRRGRASVAEPPFDTAMGGLAAGVASTIAWDFLAPLLDAALALPEDAWVAGAEALESGRLGARIVAGPSGAAGIGALLALARLPGIRKLLGLDTSARVGALVTETRFD